MIPFACLCKHRFEVDEETAGGMIQCPACGRLNDVPTLGDLPHLSEDGTYEVDVDRPRDDPARLAQLGLYYSKSTHDADGDEIDLRIRPEDIRAPRGDPDDDGIPLSDDVNVARRRVSPKYDPETGELIRPIDLKPDPGAEPVDPSTIPVAKAAINYARGETAKRVTPMRALVELLMPVNVAVMLFVFVVHVFLQIGLIVVLTGLVFIFAAPLIMAMLLVSHYGNVIDEIGPQDRDELPRPLRTVSLRDDLWDPFVNVAAAFMLCYLPVAVVAARATALPAPAWAALVLLLLLAATVLLPAVLLTTTTSGTFANLRPDRLWGVVRTCGPNYAVAVIAGFLMLVCYGGGILASDMALVTAMNSQTVGNLPRWAHWAIGYPLLSVGIYIAHFFCWYLGLLYRAHHDAFPWAFQRHVRDPAVQAKRFGSRLPDADTLAGLPRPARRDTHTKLRELRERERGRRAQRESVQDAPPQA
jgi:hypothetical protein